MLVKPTVFGYMKAWIDSPDQAGLSCRQALTDFVTREGFVLAQVFVAVSDSDAALASLIEATTFHEVAAVVVPDPRHLGKDVATRLAMQARIEAAIDRPVLFVAVLERPRSLVTA